MKDLRGAKIALLQSSLAVVVAKEREGGTSQLDNRCDEVAAGVYEHSVARRIVRQQYVEGFIRKLGGASLANTTVWRRIAACIGSLPVDAPQNADVQSAWQRDNVTIADAADTPIKIDGEVVYRATGTVSQGVESVVVFVIAGSEIQGFGQIRFGEDVVCVTTADS